MAGKSASERNSSLYPLVLLLGAWWCCCSRRSPLHLRPFAAVGGGASTAGNSRDKASRPMMDFWRADRIG